VSLSINIVEFPEGCEIEESSKIFNEQGGTIGRASDNFWKLNDPDCYLSSHHSSISYQGGNYFLIDTSTNGTFLNGAGEPIGRGNKIQLQDGDEFELSDYKFKVNLSGTGNFSDSPFPESTSPFDLPSSFDASGELYNEPFIEKDINVEPMLNSIPQETDPLAVLGDLNKPFEEFGASSETDYFSSNVTHSDQANIINQAIEWPESRPKAAIIPEDWNLDGSNVDNKKINQTADYDKPTHISKSNVQLNNKSHDKLKAENQQLQLELNKTKQQLVSLHKKYKKYKDSTSVSVDLSVISALGMTDYDFDEEKILEINKKAGEIVRETVIRMMQVISSRNNIKNEFRLNVTTIKPVENNPLKFSATVDDALKNMFIQEGNAYKKPVESIEDAFQGIAEHQVAVLAGIRSAFSGLITRFEPNKLEERFDRYGGSGLDMISMVKKSRNWEQFINYYSDLVDDMDNSFQKLFGENFVDAYEEQLQKLVQSREFKQRSK
jgi:type VI secretion system FHA domain protein